MYVYKLFKCIPHFSSLRRLQEPAQACRKAGQCSAHPSGPQSWGPAVLSPPCSKPHHLWLLLQLLQRFHPSNATAGSRLWSFQIAHSLPKTALENPIASLIQARNEFYQGCGVCTDPIKLLEGMRTVLSNVKSSI